MEILDGSRTSPHSAVLEPMLCPPDRKENPTLEVVEMHHQNMPSPTPPATCKTKTAIGCPEGLDPAKRLEIIPSHLINKTNAMHRPVKYQSRQEGIFEVNSKRKI
jgi:hypothetical protein